MRVFRTTAEGCLGDISLQILHKLKLEFVEKKVKTLTGISLRKFVRIKIGTQAGEEEVFADWVTGTLYRDDGSCLSSDKITIVETDEKPYCSIKNLIDAFKFGHGADYEYGSN